jgi:hypothetical protein
LVSSETELAARFVHIRRKALRFSALPASFGRLLSKDSAVFARDALYSIFLIF